MHPSHTQGIQWLKMDQRGGWLRIGAEPVTAGWLGGGDLIRRSSIWGQRMMDRQNRSSARTSLSIYRPKEVRVVKDFAEKLNWAVGYVSSMRTIERELGMRQANW